MKNLCKIIFLILLLAAAAFLLPSCNRVEPNTEGVLMTNYGRDGKKSFEKVVGTQGPLWFGSELYLVPLNEETGDPSKVTILSKNSGAFTVDPVYTYKVIPSRGTDVIFNFKYMGVDKNFFDNIERAVLNNMVTNAYREEARNFSTDSILNNMQAYEVSIENRLRKQFDSRGFYLANLTSGLTPPPSMIKAIEARNNTKIEGERVNDQLEVSRRLQAKALIDAKTNEIISAGLSKEILQQQFIEALKDTKNKVIVTNGSTPVLIN